MTVLKYDDVIKNDATRIPILVFFERSYVARHPCKVSQLGVNQFRIYDERTFRPPGLFNVKKAQVGRVNKQSSIVVTVNIFHDLSSVFSTLYCGKCDSYFVTIAANIHITTAQTAETAENEISRYTNVIDSPEEFNKSFEHSNVSFEKILNFNF